MAKLTTKYAGDFPAADAGGRRQLGNGWINLPLMGGEVTKKARQLLPFGRGSLARNVRSEHPGYKSRGGSKKLHATAVGSRVMSLFHYCKGRVTERHFLAQFADGTIREAANDPPAVGDGAFGATLFSGNSAPYPAAWAVMDDVLIFSTGADLPHFWAGDEDRVAGFFVYDGDGTIPAIPDGGTDYTVEVTDDDAATVAVLDSFTTDHCLMIRTALPRLTGFRVEVAQPNRNAATVSIQKYNGAWVSAGAVTDTTVYAVVQYVKSGTYQWTRSLTGAVDYIQSGTYQWTLALWGAIAFVESGVYYWVASGAGTNEYYMLKEAAYGGPNPNIAYAPAMLAENGAPMTLGTIGSLAAGEWAWGDNDTLGFSTAYVRLSDGADPDSKADGYVSAVKGEFYLEADGGGDPGVSEPAQLLEDGAAMDEGTTGVSLNAGEWIYEDRDSLGFSTIYVRLTDTTDPDTKVSGYLFSWGVSEYYLEADGGGDPSVSEPSSLNANGSAMSAGTIGSLAAGAWDYGAAAADDLGFSTIYVRLADDADPDTKADGYLSTGGATLAKDGAWTLAAPVTDAVAVYQQGVCGFWWRVFFSAALDSQVEVSEVRYSADPSPLQIVWDSIMAPAVECQYYLAADDIYYRYDYTTCDLSEMAASDKLYMCFADPIEAFYLDMGESPSTAGTTIAKVGRWDGAAWVESDPVADGSEGAGKSGWVTIGRPTNPDQARQFGANQWRGYWYYVRFTSALSDNVLATVYGQPFYDVADFGTKCLCCAAWKHRALYVFERYPQYIYVSSIRRPMSLRGNDSNILDPGDGRAHAVRAIVCFHNEILVLQEERGTIGGCTTLYQGRDNATFGKRILSTRIGTWTPKSVVVVEGVYLTTATEERVATVVYWLSWHGLVRCDGRGVMDAVSDPVADRFDPLKPATCVRRGYEDRCGLFYDRSAHVLRVWLVCGTTATEPNWFGVYDLMDGAWYEDSYANHWTAMCEAEAASGDVAVLQVAGDSDGYIRQLNTGSDDDGTAIDHRLELEFSAGSRWVTLHELRARLEAAPGASLTVAAARDGRTEDAKYAIDIPLSAKVSGEETVTARREVKVAAGHITLSLYGPQMALHDLAVRATVEEER